MSESKSMWPALQLSRWVLIGLATNVAAVVFFACLAGKVFEGDTLGFDESIRESISQLASPWLTAVMQGITFIGSGLFLLCIGGLISVGFIFAKWRRALLMFIITMAGATVLNVTLKVSFKRTRPASFFGTPLPSSFSFPSGHALLSLCFYCAIAYLIVSRFDNPAIRCAALSAALLLVLAIGFSRIYLGVHYPSDVIAGYAAGIFWILTVILLDRVVLQKRIAN